MDWLSFLNFDYCSVIQVIFVLQTCSAERNPVQAQPPSSVINSLKVFAYECFLDFLLGDLFAVSLLTNKYWELKSSFLPDCEIATYPRCPVKRPDSSAQLCVCDASTVVVPNVSTLAFSVLLSLLLGWQLFTFSRSFSNLCRPYISSITYVFRLARHLLICLILFVYLIYFISLITCVLCLLVSYLSEGSYYQYYCFICLPDY